MCEAQSSEGLTVLLVEDNPLVAMDLAHQLTDLGMKVCGPCHTVEDALNRIDATDLDFGILDFNLKKGRTSRPIAKRLERQSIPFCFLSGYSSTDLLDMAGFENVPCLSKPVDQRELSRALEQIGS